MPKRLRDDNAVENSARENATANGARKKARKVESHDKSLLVTSGPAAAESLSKEQETQLRRLKRLEDSSNRLGSAEKEKNDILSDNGHHRKKIPDDDERSQGKAARKAARRTKRASIKAKKSGMTTLKNEVPTLGLHSIDADISDGMLQQLSQSRSKDSAKKSGYTEDPNLTALPRSEIESFLNQNFITVTDQASSVPLRPIINFSHLPSANLKGNSPFATFKSPTPIQAASWPFLFSGRDVIGVAETGSGKTLAFGIPCIQSISSALPSSRSHRAVAKAVVVSPTRELAVQIHGQLLPPANSAGLSTVCVYGGVPKDPQRLALATAHIIIATPGRLNDLITDGAADLSQVNYLVLDEADRMLDKGFEEDIRKIIACTPSSVSGRRQTLMFTATWPPSVRALASTFMNSPVHIFIGKDNPTGELRANTSITQKVEVLAPTEKEARLLQLVKAHQSGTKARDRILVFCLYKKEAVRVENFLRMRGRHVVAIHGDMNQGARSKSLEAFRQGECPLLVATDVAARGLDIPEVKLVLNMTFPLTVEDYVHRIGR